MVTTQDVINSGEAAIAAAEADGDHELAACERRLTDCFRRIAKIETE